MRTYRAQQKKKSEVSCGPKKSSAEKILLKADINFHRDADSSEGEILIYKDEVREKTADVKVVVSHRRRIENILRQTLKSRYLIS